MTPEEMIEKSLDYLDSIGEPEPTQDWEPDYGPRIRMGNNKAHLSKAVRKAKAKLVKQSKKRNRK